MRACAKVSESMLLGEFRSHWRNRRLPSVHWLAVIDRRLVAKYFLVAGHEEAFKAFAGRNYGVGCPGGVEVVTHSLRDALNKHKGSKLGLLKIDFRNAFNLIKRTHFVKSACEMFPAMSS